MKMFPIKKEDDVNSLRTDGDTGRTQKFPKKFKIVETY
jgi:hypothetical protein